MKRTIINVSIICFMIIGIVTVGLLKSHREKLEEMYKTSPDFDLAITSIDLENMKSHKLPIVIDFGSEGCAPCRRMYPILEELNKELRGKAIIKFIDVWEYPDSYDGFEFSLIPTQFFINADGSIYSSHTGIMSKEEIIDVLMEMGMKK